MVSRMLRSLAIVGVVAAVTFACSAQAPACAFLDRIFGGGNACEPAPAYQVSYAPSCSTCVSACPTPGSTYSAGYAPSCVTCSPTPTVTYRPVADTRYRFRLVREPVTSYRPVVTTDPCSGCQTTAYQPVTNTRLRFRWVPYTTYRTEAVYSATPSMSCYNPCASCVPCGTDACGNASYGGGCPGGVCGPVSYSGSSSCPSGVCGETTTYNGGSTATGSAAPQTFQEDSQSAEQRELKPIPDKESDAQSSAPRLLLPENNTTTRPSRPSENVRLVSSTATLLPATTTRRVPLEHNGWRPASD